MLQIPNWHRPYADLLLETDAVKRAALISRLEQEFVNRYLEQSVSPITSYEQLDLMNAAEVLRVKKAEIMALIRQRFIASKPRTARIRPSMPVSRISCASTTPLDADVGNHANNHDVRRNVGEESPKQKASPEKQRRGRQVWKGSLRPLRWLYARLRWKGQHAIAD
jgi:hypothetical protein